jgi:SAM-dependent methyltransferase
MDFTLTDPPLPSLGWYLRLRRFGGHKTILRQMEYDLLSGQTLAGRVLDFGGGQRAEYLPFLKGEAEILSVNIDTEFAPTHIVAPGDPLPFPDGHFDQVITFNTLEHVYDDRGALAELTRVLRPGGTLRIIVPFMYPVHGHPDDYNRHTPSWWGETLARLGYARAEVLPIVFGRTTAARILRGRGNAATRGLGDLMAALRDIAIARALFIGKTRYEGRRGARVWATAPGLFITAVR